MTADTLVQDPFYGQMPGWLAPTTPPTTQAVTTHPATERRLQQMSSAMDARAERVKWLDWCDNFVKNVLPKVKYGKVKVNRTTV